MKNPHLRIMWQRIVTAYEQDLRRLLRALSEVDPTKAALIKKVMPRKPRTLVF